MEAEVGKLVALLVALAVCGCVSDSEEKVRVIECGTIRFEEDVDGQLRDTVTVKNGNCSG
jgi:hypothetical protein